ncbi:MFS transporter [Aciditerrimonas ferrireducens]|uniref:MFS transporter n=1 Tax=Aciditerrimonas ferrireducens TaxID=667306 RepID=A0ABV6C4U6_9ACTN
MSRSPTAAGRSSLATWWWGTSAGAVPFLLAVTLLGRAAQNMGQTTYPLLARDRLHVANDTLGVLTALAGLAGVATSAFLTARIPSRRALWAITAGQAVTLVSFVLLALPTGLPGLWLAAAALGIGGGLVFPATMTAIGSGPQGQRARSLAVYALSLSAGLVVGPLAEAAVLHLLHERLRDAFAALLPLPLLATLLVASAARRHGGGLPGPAADGGSPRRPTPFHNDAHKLHNASEEALGPRSPSSFGSAESTEADTPLTTLPGGQPLPAPHDRSRRRPHPPLWRHPAFRLALLTLLTYQAPFAALVTFGGLLGRHVDGVSAAGVEVGFGAFFTVSFLIRALVAAHSPLRHPRLVLAGSLAATVLGLLLLAGGPGSLSFFAALAVLGAPHGVTFPLASATLAEGTDPGLLARANARMMATANLVTILVPLACGALASAFGYRVMFLTVEAPVLATALGLALERRPRPAAEPGPA